jgi:hypothetical protein
MALRGAVITEPIVYLQAQQEQADYTMYDSLAALAFSPVFGATTHALPPMVKDVFGSAKERWSSTAHTAANKKALSDALQDKPVKVDRIVENAVYDERLRNLKNPDAPTTDPMRMKEYQHRETGWGFERGVREYGISLETPTARMRNLTPEEMAQNQAWVTAEYQRAKAELDKQLQALHDEADLGMMDGLELMERQEPLSQQREQLEQWLSTEYNRTQAVEGYDYKDSWGDVTEDNLPIEVADILLDPVARAEAIIHNNKTARQSELEANTLDDVVKSQKDFVDDTTAGELISKHYKDESPDLVQGIFTIFNDMFTPKAKEIKALYAKFGPALGNIRAGHRMFDKNMTAKDLKAYVKGFKEQIRQDLKWLHDNLVYTDDARARITSELQDKIKNNNAQLLRENRQAMNIDEGMEARATALDEQVKDTSSITDDEMLNRTKAEVDDLGFAIEEMKARNQEFQAYFQQMDNEIKSIDAETAAKERLLDTLQGCVI